MDYEKKYKEMKARVLEIGQGYVKGVDFSKPRQIAEYIDPELVESDEKIRQLLVRFVTLHMGDNYSNNISKEECLAWLENQNSNLDNANNEYWRGYREGKQEIIDKYAELEKQAEQNPMNKNKHKFHEGDWIVFNNHHDSIYQVEKIENYEYTLRHFLGGSMHLSFSHEDMIRAWTLKDAKDGDVICSGQIILLFKKWEDSDWNFVIAYAGIDVSGKLQITNGHWLIANDSHPATKEQRAILFQKMNEANYEWDADRKELCTLSKSEATSDQVTQQSTLDVKNETAEKLIALAECLEMDGDCLFNGLSGNNYGKFLRVLAKELTEIKPAEWSEEDEAMFHGVIETEQYMLDVVYGRKIFAVGNEDLKEECTKELAWLKSLKDRIK